jgi:hypothetical protein
MTREEHAKAHGFVEQPKPKRSHRDNSKAWDEYKTEFLSENSRDRRFFAWVRQAEDMLGHGLDGDQSVDGYSLDYARTAFDEGWSVVEYVLTVKANSIEAGDL